MRRTAVVGFMVLFAALLGCTVLGQMLCGFRMPVSDIVDADMSFAYRYFDDAATSGTDESAGRFSTSYSGIYDSPAFGYSSTLSTDITLADLVPSVWQAYGGVSYRYYVSSELPLFVYGGALGNADTNLPQLGLELRGGVGYGRLREVTPLSQAHRISAGLVALGAIPGPVASSALQRVASIIGRRGDFQTASDLVSAIETEIETAAGVELNAAALLMIEDEIESSGDQRFCGLIVQAGVGQELLDAHGGPRDVRYVMSLDAAYPPTASNQLRIRSSLSSSFDILADHTLLVEATYAASPSKAVRLESRYSLHSVRVPGRPDVTTYSASASFSLGTGPSSVIAGVSLSHSVGSAGWTVDISMSTAIDLL